MRAPVAITALVLICAGIGVFFWKFVVHDMPVSPDASARVWRLDWTIPLEDARRSTSVELALPSSTREQAIVEEFAADTGLSFAVREEAGAKIGTWQGDGRESDPTLQYSVRVYLPRPSGDPLDAPPTAAAPAPPTRRPTARAFGDALEQIGVDRNDAPRAVIAQLFSFVANETEPVELGPRDPQHVLRNREGSLEGRHDLLRALLQSAGLDARLRYGVRLPRRGTTRPEPFVEVLASGRPHRLSISEQYPNDFPRDFVVLSGYDRAYVSSRGASLGTIKIDVLRESRPPDEMASFVAPSNALLRASSLYRLPVATRRVLESLLVLPLAVLVAALFRNVVGLRTFGTFMPVLIALSIRDLGLVAGFLLIGGCLGVGVLGRLALDRLRLLFVPRVCLLLCLVILSVTGLAQIGHAYGVRDLGEGLLFPIVILAMLIERISVSTLEEGWVSSAKLLAGSLVVVGASYPLYRSEFLAHLFFGFPELVLCVMGLLVLVGGYTGYRVAELWRFRSFLSGGAQAEESAA